MTSAALYILSLKSDVTPFMSLVSSHASCYWTDIHHGEMTQGSREQEQSGIIASTLVSDAAQATDMVSIMPYSPDTCPRFGCLPSLGMQI